MAALTQARMTRETRLKNVALPLAIGAKCFTGGACYADFLAGVVRQGQGANPAMMRIGEFIDQVDNTSGGSTVLVLVSLNDEIILRFYDNDAGSPVGAANIFQNCYALDDHTVTMAAQGASIAGRVWTVDTINGVGVQEIRPVNGVLATPAATNPAGYTANDLALVAASLQLDAVYDVPATAAASTITLPVAGVPDGMRVYFAADGVKNSFTVQYRDATGPTAITAALTLGKRHLVECVKKNGQWFATAGVSP